MLFVAQINLADVPRELTAGGTCFAMPVMPRDGTLYVFWAPDGDMADTRILYAAADQGPLVAQEPPEVMPDYSTVNAAMSELLGREGYSNFLVDAHGLTAQGRVLRQMAFDVLPYLSSHTENHVLQFPNAQDEDLLAAHKGLTAFTDASLETVLGRADVPPPEFSFPWLPALDLDAKDTPPEKMLSRLLGRLRPKAEPEEFPEGFDETTGAYHVPQSFPWDWSVVQEVATAIKQCATLRSCDLDVFRNLDTPVLVHVWHDAPAQAEEWLTRCPAQGGPIDASAASAFRTWLQHLSTAAKRLDVVQDPDPAVVAACAPLLQIITTRHDRTLSLADGQLSPSGQAAQDILPMIGCVDVCIPSKESRRYYSGNSGRYQSDELLAVPYFELWDAEYGVSATLQKVLRKAITRCVAELWKTPQSRHFPADLFTLAQRDVQRQTTLPMPRDSGNIFGDESRAPIQMFGAGLMMQTAVQDNADNVLLFQLSDGFGLPIKLHDGVIQIWITPDDLAQGHFDRAFTTFECT